MENKHEDEVEDEGEKEERKEGRRTRRDEEDVDRRNERRGTIDMIGKPSMLRCEGCEESARSKITFHYILARGKIWLFQFLCWRQERFVDCL